MFTIEFIAIGYCLSKIDPSLPSHTFTPWNTWAVSKLFREIGSATAERAGQGEAGGCTQRVQTAWLCLGSVVERSWSALGRPFLPFLA